MYATVPCSPGRAITVMGMDTGMPKPQSLSPLIDRIEQIRDELLAIQRALEARESSERKDLERKKVSRSV
jgi:hypothetical protein